MGVISRTLLRDKRGQATVELAVVIPMFLVIAAICFNAMMFLGDCSAFDREFRNAVRIYATSPKYNESPTEACAKVQEFLQATRNKERIQVDVTVSSNAYGLTVFQATADFAPTLFGQELRSEIFGIPLPHVQHSDEFAINAYEIGVIP